MRHIWLIGAAQGETGGPDSFFDSGPFVDTALCALGEHSDGTCYSTVTEYCRAGSWYDEPDPDYARCLDENLSEAWGQLAACGRGGGADYRMGSSPGWEGFGLRGWAVLLVEDQAQAEARGVRSVIVAEPNGPSWCCGGVTEVRAWDAGDRDARCVGPIFLIEPPPEPDQGCGWDHSDAAAAGLALAGLLTLIRGKRE